MGELGGSGSRDVHCSFIISWMKQKWWHGQNFDRANLNMFISAAIHTQSVWKAAYTYITTKADEIENYNKVKVTHRTLMLELEWTLTHSTIKQIKQSAQSAIVYIQAWDDIPCSRKGGLMRMAPSSCPCALALALWCWWTNSQKEQSGSWMSMAHYMPSNLYSDKVLVAEFSGVFCQYMYSI